MEFQRIKNHETYLTFPLLDSVNYEPYYTSAWSSLSASSIVSYSWTDSTSAVSHTITSIPNRIASSGLWQLHLSASEMNPNSGNGDYMIVKMDAQEIASQTILIKLVNADFNDVTDAIKAKTDLLSFSGSNLNVRILDSGVLNDITVADILSGTIDTKTVSEILEILLAYSSGRISVSGNVFTYYKQNNSSSAFTLTGSASERTRS